MAVGEPLLVLSRDGALGGREAKLASRREFAGYWEYLLPDALFTTPPHGDFAGAALIDRSERLVGHRLAARAATPPAPRSTSPGNMFVPTDTLPPILGDLLALGHRDGPGHPWVGVSAQEHGGHLIVRSVADDGPAADGRRPPGRHPGRRGRCAGRHAGRALSRHVAAGRSRGDGALADPARQPGDRAQRALDRPHALAPAEPDLLMRTTRRPHDPQRRRRGIANAAAALGNGRRRGGRDGLGARPTRSAASPTTGSATASSSRRSPTPRSTASPAT